MHEFKHHDWDSEWHMVADVVVVGSGAAAFSAALTAVSSGSSVLMLEKGDHPGGTTAKSGGSAWIPNNRRMGENGFTDSRDDALRYISRLAYPHLYDPNSPTLGLREDDFELIEALYDSGPKAIDTLVEIGALHFPARRNPAGELLQPHPDYQAHLLENGKILGRSLSPGVPPDMVFPNELTADRGFIVGGAIMIESLRRAAERLEIRLHLNHQVMDVASDDDGRVVGVLVRAGGDTRLIGARKGVVFASGGFLMDPRRRHYLRGPVYGGCAVETNTGDFLTIAGKLGADFGNMAHAWWDQMLLELALRVPSTVEDIWYPFGDSMILVNKYGNRVVNEKQPYNERAQAHFFWDAGRQEYPNLLMFQIYDDAVAQNPLKWPYRGLMPLPDETRDYVISGDTLEELATNIRLRLHQLEGHTGCLRLDSEFLSTLDSTIERFNRFAEEGRDKDFLRGDSPLQQIIQGPAREGVKNPCLAPIASQGPYHCMILVAGALDTKGGPRINGKSQVVTTSGSAIPGLYGAGNCISSPVGQGYPGAGATIGSALTFGYLAGSHVAQETATVRPVITI